MTLALVPLMAALGPAAVLLLAAVVFAETGLLVGFFLPGDTLLFAAGLFSATGVIPVPVALTVLLTWVAASAGDQLAYAVGRRLGQRGAQRGTGWAARLLQGRHGVAAHAFFERHGHKAVVLARFVPLARTFTPVVAGAVGMPRRRFSAYNLAGGLAWVALMIAAGWFLGGVPLVAAHVDLAVLALVAASLVPAGLGWAVRRWQRSRRRGGSGLARTRPELVRPAAAR